MESKKTIVIVHSYIQTKHKIVKSAGLILLAVMFLAGCWIKEDDPANSPSLSPDQYQVIPDSGGVVSGETKTDYIFTPDSTRIWRFDITEGGEGGITLEIFDPDGDRIGHNTRWIYLHSGISYKISMDVWTYTVGIKNSYTLTISPAGVIPDDGGEVQVDSEARYMFTPELTGLWTFSTYVNSGEGEPMVWIWDILKNEEVGDNAEAGVFYDSITLELVAGNDYSVNVSFWINGTGNYTLTVSPASPKETPTVAKPATPEPASQHSDEWPDNEFTRLLPKPDFTVATAVTTETDLFVLFSDATIDQMRDYAELVKAAGFIFDAETKDTEVSDILIFSYTAKNADGFLVDVFSAGWSAGVTVSK